MLPSMRRLPMESLPDHPLLAALTSAQLEQLAQGSERIELEANESLFAMGDPVRRFFVVESGQVKIFRISPHGQEKVIELMRPGHTFAEAAMFMSDRRYPANCTALAQTRLAALNSDIFLNILAESPQTGLRVMASLSMKLRARIADIESLAFQNATHRVIGFLLSLVPVGEDIDQIALPFSKKMIAARVSVQPETLSRVFAKLTSQGLLRVDGDVLHLPRLAELRGLSWAS